MPANKGWNRNDSIVWSDIKKYAVFVTEKGGILGRDVTT